MLVVITGASGLIGPATLSRLRERGDEARVLSRDPERAQRTLGVPALHWDPLDGPPPEQALAGADAVINLAGEPVAQRWSATAKLAIRESRVRGTANLVTGLERMEQRPRVLLAASAVGYYGDRGAEPLDESADAGKDFLGQVCLAWEAEAATAEELGVRVACMRTGVVLARHGGALAKMLPPFRLGIGGPVAGGRQFIPWIHLDDTAGLYTAALDDERYRGPINATAPEPVSNHDFSKALGRALGRPAIAPVPAITLRLLYGEMAEIVTTGANARPAKALSLGYRFEHPDLDEALRSALA